MTDNYLWTPWRMQYLNNVDAAPGEGVKPGGESSASDGAAEGEGRDRPDLPPPPPRESTGCVFCDRFFTPAEYDRHNLILHRGERNFVIMNLYPYNSAHLMIVPNEHTADFAGLDRETTGELMALVQRLLRVIDAEYKPQGYNLGVNLGRVAGAGVADHVHMHVVPRWGGDTNFMPIVGATRVMPELLETTYDRLKARLKTVE